MENLKFEQRMALFARKHGLHLTWQDVKFGYRRARFICESREEMTAILNPALAHPGYLDGLLVLL